jgi:thiol-disulfide isomerase/thioredoxin
MVDKSSSGSKTGIIIGVVGGLVVLLLVAAVMFGNEQIGAEYGSPELRGTSLSPMPNQVSVDTSAAGLVAPDVFGQDYVGNDVSITNDGTAKGIVFLAHWCPHCQEEVPRVQEWLDNGGGVEGVDLYSVSTAANSGQPNHPASEWLDREGWTVPIIVDDQANSVLSAYGRGGFPYWVFLNADGTVAVRTAGQLTIVQLEEILNGLEQ